MQKHFMQRKCKHKLHQLKKERRKVIEDLMYYALLLIFLLIKLKAFCGTQNYNPKTVKMYASTNKLSYFLQNTP